MLQKWRVINTIVLSLALGISPMLQASARSTGWDDETQSTYRGFDEEDPGAMGQIGGRFVQKNQTMATDEWDTTITVPTTGKYTFYLTSQLGASLYVGDLGTPLISSSYTNKEVEQSVTIRLVSGRVYPVRVVYFSNNKTAAATLTWSGSSFNKKALSKNKYSSYDEDEYYSNSDSDEDEDEDTTSTTIEDLEASSVDEDSVKLSWSEPEDADDISEYIIYRNGKMIGSSDTTSYTDTDLKSDTTYYYIVRAYDDSITYVSSKISVTTSETDSDSEDEDTVIDNFSGYVVGSAIRLYWDKDSDAEGYNVYRADTSGDEDDTPLNGSKLITKAYYSDTSPLDGTNYYIVKPVYEDGTEGDGSEEISIDFETEDEDTTESSVTNFAGTVSGDDVVLSWDAVEDAEGYNIYSSTVSGSYSNIPLTDFPITKTTFTDTKASTGTNYYIIKPVDSDGTEGDASDEISVDMDSTIIVLTLDEPTMTVNGVETYVDSEEPHETAPELDEDAGRVFVPISSIITALGGTVSWDEDDQKVTIEYNDTTIEMWIGKTKAVVYTDGDTDGETVTMDVAPYIHDEYDRTMLPIRFVVEYLGVDVQWNGTKNTITISD